MQRTLRFNYVALRWEGVKQQRTASEKQNAQYSHLNTRMGWLRFLLYASGS